MPMFFKIDDEKKQEIIKITLLPLRDVVIFPYMVAPLFVGREKSIRALEEAMKKEKEILLAAQKDANTNDPKEEDIYRIGTVGTIVQMLRLPDGTVKVLIEGKKRAKIISYAPNPSFFLVEVERVEEPVGQDFESEALMRTLVTAFENYVKLNKKIPSEV
ncbi:MAG: LON peptidase substrate-binding domain-containing protein, partial [Thermodesulfobacteriota bacterium]